MRVIGLDLGTKSLGVATSDVNQIIASSYKTIFFSIDNYEYAIEELKKIIVEQSPEKLVLGLPKNMDGSLGGQAQKTLEFKDMLEEQTKLEVILIDERLTSKMANSIMIQADLSRKKRKTKVDKLAAALILQSYLDSRKWVIMDDILIVTDENGKELECIIVMTFESEDFGKSYVVYRLKEDETGEFFAASFNPEDGEEGQLLPIETDDEWDLVEEVLENFLEDEEEKESN